MFERMTEQKEAVWVSLATLKTDITPLTPEECQIIDERLRVLAPFDQATRELSEEKRVSGSKVIPLMRMIHIELQWSGHNSDKNSFSTTGWKPEKAANWRDLQHGITQCDDTGNTEIPDFKELDLSVNKRQVKRWRDCSRSVWKKWGVKSLTLQKKSLALHKGQNPVQVWKHISLCFFVYFCGTLSCDNKLLINYFFRHNLWKTLDMEVAETQKTSNVTADSIIEVQHLLAEANTPRNQDPLQYWKWNQKTNPHLHQLALQTLCSPSSSVPCDRVFSKAKNFCSSIKIHKVITFLSFISYDLTVNKNFLHKLKIVTLNCNSNLLYFTYQLSLAFTQTRNFFTCTDFITTAGVTIGWPTRYQYSANTVCVVCQ